MLAATPLAIVWAVSSSFLAQVIVATVCPSRVACEFLFVLGGVVFQSGLRGLVDAGCYAHCVVDLARHVPRRLVRSDSVVFHARDSVANAL